MSNLYYIQFNVPKMIGNETVYMQEALTEQRRISGGRHSGPQPGVRATELCDVRAVLRVRRRWRNHEDAAADSSNARWNSDCDVLLRSGRRVGL